MSTNVNKHINYYLILMHRAKLGYLVTKVRIALDLCVLIRYG